MTAIGTTKSLNSSPIGIISFALILDAAISTAAYLLEVPYADDRELLMDVLRHGNEEEVLGPVALRKRIREY